MWNGVLHMNPAPSGRHANIAQQLAELLGPPARRRGWTAIFIIFNLGESATPGYRGQGLRRDAKEPPSTTRAPHWCSRSSRPMTRPGRSCRSTPPRVGELLIVNPRERTVAVAYAWPATNTRPMKGDEC